MYQLLAGVYAQIRLLMINKTQFIKHFIERLNASHGKVNLYESFNRTEDGVDRRPQADVD